MTLRTAALTTYALVLAFVCTVSLVVMIGRIGPETGVQDRSDEVAALALKATDLDGYVTRFSGDSFDPFLADQSVLTDHAVAATILGRHTRSYLSVDRSRILTVELSLHADEDRYRAIVRLIGTPQDSPLPGLPSAAHSVLSDSQTFVERMAVLTKGNLGMRVTAGASGPNASEESLGLLVATINSQLEKAEAAGGIEHGSSTAAAGTSLAPLQLRLALYEVVAIVGGALLLGLRTVVSDRGTRERARLLLSRSRSESTGVSVAARAGALRRRSALAGGLSVLAAASVALGISALRLAFLGVGGMILILAFFAHGLVLRWTGMIGHGTRALVPRFHSWSRPVGVVAFAATVALLGFGAGGLYASIVTDALGAPGYSPAQTEAASAWFRFVGAFLVLISPVPLIVARRIALLASSGQLQRDKRRHTLLLRSFADDGLRIRSRTLGASSLLSRLTLRRWERFEEVVARAVAPIGPIVALNDPGKRLPELGAVRETASDDVWRDRIRELIDTAALIVVFVARTEHCAMEFQELRTRGALDRAVFIVPPVAPDERRRRLNVLSSYLDLDPRDLDHDVPGNRVLAVVIHPTAGPVPITSDCVDDVGYQLAVEAAAETLRSGPLPAEAREHAAAVPPVDWKGQSMLWRPGHAPRKRRWFVRPWGIATVLFLIGGVLDLAGGVAPIDAAPYDVIDTDGNVRDLARDPSTDRVYALDYDGVVLRVDTGTANEVARIDGDIRRLHAAQGWLIATDLEGVVHAVDTDSGRTWRQALGAPPTAVTALGEQLFLTVAPTEEVIRLDLRSGERTAAVRLPGTPWGITTLEGRLYASLTTRSEVIELDPDTLETRERIPTPEAPTDLGAVDRRLIVHVAPQSALISLDPLSHRQAVLHRSNLVFAVEGEPSSAVPMLESRDLDTSVLQIGRSASARCTMPLLDRPGTAVATSGGTVYATIGDYRDIIRIAPCD